MSSYLPDFTSNRSFKNYILYPKIQLQYALLFAFILFLEGVFLIAIQVSFSYKVSQYIENQDLLNIIQGIQAKQFIFQIMMLVTSAVLMFFAAIVTMHRFLGPLIPIIRHFEELRTKGSAAPLSIRKDDALYPLVDYINKMDIKVSEKKS